MIEAVRGERGRSCANVRCDGCGREESLPVPLERNRGKPLAVNEGHVVRKLQKRGWTLISGNLRCPDCSASRKQTAADTTEEPPMAVAEKAKTSSDLRRPTPAQKRQIIGLLEDAYDDDAKRYRNPSDTDKTLAEVIGGGCMWGWVAEIREELFGPDTRNAELDAIRTEMKALDQKIEKATDQAHEVAKVLEQLAAQQSELSAKLTKVTT